MTTTTEKIRMNVTTSELTSILMTKERNSFSYLITETIVRMNKTNNPYYGEVKKISKIRPSIGVDYKKRVEKEMGIENFVPQPCKVGEHVSKSVLFNENTGKNYLQYEYFPEIKTDVEYKHNGNPIDKQLFESFMVKSSPNKYGVNLVSVTIDNIKEIHIDGYEYIVVNP